MQHSRHQVLSTACPPAVGSSRSAASPSSTSSGTADHCCSSFHLLPRATHLLSGPSRSPPGTLHIRPWPWAGEFQKIDTHMQNDQPFHFFGTFCQSADNMEKCDPCYRTWNVLAESDCCVCQHLSPLATFARFLLAHASNVHRSL